MTRKILNAQGHLTPAFQIALLRRVIKDAVKYGKKFTSERPEGDFYMMESLENALRDTDVASSKALGADFQRLVEAVDEWRRYYLGWQDYNKKFDIWCRLFNKVEARLQAARRAMEMEQAAKPKTIQRYLRVHAERKALDAERPRRPTDEKLEQAVLTAAWKLTSSPTKTKTRRTK